MTVATDHPPILVPEFCDPAMVATIISRIPYEPENLSKEVEYHCFRKYNYLRHIRSDSRALLMRQFLTTQYFRTAIAAARQYYRAYHGIEWAEAVSEGSLALVRVIPRFDYSGRGTRFSTFLFVCVRRAMLDVAKVSRRRNKRVLPIEWEDVVDSGDFAYNIDRVDEYEALVQPLFRALSKQERRILKLFYLRGQTTHEVAATVQLGETSVYLIRRTALHRLRAAIRLARVVGVKEAACRLRRNASRRTKG